MKPSFSFYSPADFGRVHRFLSERADLLLPYDPVRFQFCLGLHPDLVSGGACGGFERTCGLWEDEAGLASLALTEGGTRWGETFFAFRSDQDKTPDLLGRMADFAERFTSRVADDRKSNAYALCVPEDDAVLAAFVARRGYQSTQRRERVLIKPYPAQPERAGLPEGFVIRDARTASPFLTALAHSHAFRYNQDDDGGGKGFAAIRRMPGYRPELDLILLDPEGQPAGLANFWVREGCSTASVEPLGVVWWYRRRGLGRALITEGINRTRALGCARLIGGDQPFYWDLGFESVRESRFWAWSSPRP